MGLQLLHALIVALIQEVVRQNVLAQFTDAVLVPSELLKQSSSVHFLHVVGKVVQIVSVHLVGLQAPFKTNKK